MDLKSQHEKFIINEEGTSILRYMVFCIQLCPSIFISKIIINTFLVIKRNRLLSFLIEFIFVHSFTILSTTILDDYYLLVFFLQVLFAISILQIQRTKTSYRNLKDDLNYECSESNLSDMILTNDAFCKTSSIYPENSNDTESNLKNEGIKSILFNILVGSIIMILAVDFKVFPRKNAKIEHFGIGLMDAGAISFLAINSTLSPEVRLFRNFKKSKKDKNSSIKFKVLTKNLYSCSILLMIGLIRLYTIKKLNYQEHVSEYGVHINFFILLAIIKFLGMIITFIFNHLVFNPLFSILFIFLHEFLLKFVQLSNYLQKDGDRHSFIDKNKESFCTLIGYLGFYLSCFCLSNFLQEFNRDVQLTESNELTQKSTNKLIKSGLDNKSYRSIESRYKVIYSSLKFCLLYFILFELSDQFSEQISRRNMNMAFTCLNLSILYLMVSIEYFLSILLIRYYRISTSKLIIQDAFTNNGLIVFLFANILTGLVNMSTNTTQTPDLSAIFLLFVYSAIISISITFLDSLNNFY